MAIKNSVSMKRIQIDKANSRAMIIVAVTTVITVFCLMSTKALISQASYQRRVIDQKHKAVDQLIENLKNAKSLSAQYEVFKESDPNIIGGKGGISPGDGPNDGDNPKIVLDSLPGVYDFPALVSSVEKIVTGNHVTPEGIGGTDTGQTTTATQADTTKPSPTPIPFTLQVSSSYASIQKLMKDLERSIRPMDVAHMELSGSSADMKLSANVTTYYQPGSSLIITEKEVK